MMLGKRLAGLLVLTTAALLTGCTSTPEANSERDVAARAFESQRDAGIVYVYRPDRPSADGFDSVLMLDDRLIGSTLPGTFFRLVVRPGGHILHGWGPDTGALAFDARAGETMFVRLSVVAGHSQFDRVTEAGGRAAVLACCRLLENWAAGQRPLIR